MKDFSALKSVGEADIKSLDYRRQALYYERFLTSRPPEELKDAPVRRRASLLKFMARRTLVFFIGLLLLICLVLVLSVYATGGLDLRLLLLILPVGAGVPVVLFRDRLRAFFGGLYSSSEARLERRFTDKMGRYSDYLSRHEQQVKDYGATLMDEKTALGIIDACITARGLKQVKIQFGMKEDDLLVFRYIKYPAGGAEKELDGLTLCQKYKVQYIALTKDEICEITGTCDVFDDILDGESASGCILEDVDRVDLRGDDNYSTQFYCVVANGKDTLFLPSKYMLPEKQYTITSFSWNKADKNAGNADYISRTRRELEKRRNSPLGYSDFDKIRSQAYTAGASDVEFAVSDACEEEHTRNFEAVRTLVERSLNVLVKEKRTSGEDK